MILHFNSVAELRDYWISTGAAGRRDETSLDWFGNETKDQTKQWSLTGNTDLVPAAEKIIDQLDTSIEVDRRVVTECVAGGWPSVPDALAGRPLAMRRLTHASDEHSPINIYVNVVSSAGVNAKTLHKRGCTILALVMALSRIRPVQLNLVSTIENQRDPDGKGETVFIVKINTAPLDIASACWALTSQGFCRRMTYTIGYEKYNFRGGWPKTYDYGNQGKKYMKYLQERLAPGQEAHTLMISPSELHDLILTDPVRWVNDQIRHFTSAEEE